MLNVIDVHSRFAYTVPMKTKELESVFPAMTQVFKVMGKPKNFNSDLESAFLSTKFQKMLKEDNIKHWQHNPVDEKRNMSIIERFNRTIREVLQKYFYS